MNFPSRCVIVITSILALAACSRAIDSQAIPSAPTSPSTSSSNAKKFDNHGFTTLHSFGNGTDGAGPSTRLVLVGSKFYGTTFHGGTDGLGTVFSLTSNGYETVIHSFKETDGWSPYGDLIAIKGALYGTTSIGGTADLGVVFRVTPMGRFKVLHSFLGGADDGQVPHGGLTALNGAFYGTTTQGGPHNDGTVYSISSSGGVHIIHSFDGSDGSIPTSRLLLVNGNFYGTTSEGGRYNGGTVFRLGLDGHASTIHNFGYGLDAARPNAGLVEINGTLYGTTVEGGAHFYGTVYKIDLSGHESVLYSFDGGAADGCPYAGLTVVSGMLYGVTNGGDASPCTGEGAIFRVSTTGEETTLHTFSPGKGGSFPYGGLLSTGGRLYGETTYGGYHTWGTVFSLTP